MADDDDDDDDDDELRCPHCGGKTEMGYGLAGGGIGPYTYCMACGRMLDKWQDLEMEPTK